jgi:methylthioribose-1-phosphate isomerase
MKVQGRAWRSIEAVEGGAAVCVIDQTRLPFHFEVLTLRTLQDVAHAISSMQVRGAPLIGAAGAWGLALAARVDASAEALQSAARVLCDTRPTAVNLRRVVEDTLRLTLAAPAEARVEVARRAAQAVCDDEVEKSRRIGAHGLTLLKKLQAAKGGRLDVLTHCNAGWLATVDYGTALAPLYLAHDAGIPLHVWVAAPESSIDWTSAKGAEVPIEERAAASLARRAPALPRLGHSDGRRRRSQRRPLRGRRSLRRHLTRGAQLRPGAAVVRGDDPREHLPGVAGHALRLPRALP